MKAYAAYTDKDVIIAYAFICARECEPIISGLRYRAEMEAHFK